MKTTSILYFFPASLVGFFFALVQPAFALDMEFYTYNGFGPVSQSFSKIALIFSDGGYNGLFFSIIVLGILAAAFSFTIKSATGAKLMPLSWIYPVIGGVIIYLALFIPKGTITVYDPVLNRFQAIAGIPNGVVFTAGVLNKIERGIVDIIDTAGLPGAKYQDGAGGIGFTALKEAMNAPVKNNYLQQSLAQYVGDCVMFEMTLPGTTFSVDNLTYTSNNFLTEFAKAANPSVFTVYYDDTLKEGATMSCADAWTGLNGDLNNPATYQDSLKAVCGASLFDSNSALELQQCKDLISNTLLNQTGIAANPEDVVRQGFMTQVIYQVISDADPKVTMALQGNRQIVTSGMGMASSLNEWLPIMRAIMTAIAIGLIPFLVLFIPTPLFGKGLGAMAGFFVFLTTWGVADAIVHGAALDYSTIAMEDIRQSGLGLATCLNFPETSTKIMGMFGMIRGSSIMLASFLTTMLVKFGGHALAMMSGNLQGAVAGGGQAAARTLTPEGHAQAKEQLINAAGADGWMNSNSFGDMARASQNARNLSTQANTTGFEAKYAGAQAQGFKGSRQEFMAAMNSEGSYINKDGSKSTVMGATGASKTSHATNSLGFTMEESVGTDGTKTRQYKQGGAVAMTTVQKAGGQEELQQATLSNINGKVGQQYQNVMVNKAAEGLSSNKQYGEMMSYTSSRMKSSADARQFSDTQSNNESQIFSRSLKDGSMMSNVKSEELNNALRSGGSVSIGTPGKGIFGSGAEAHAGYEAQITSKDGKTTSVSLSTEDAQTLQHHYQHVRQEALTQTLQDQKMRQWAEQATRNESSTESNSLLKEAMRRDTDSAGLEANAMPVVLRQIADKYYHGDMQEAAYDLNHQAGVAPGKAMSRIEEAIKEQMTDHGQVGFIDRVQGNIENNREKMEASANMTAANDAGNMVPHETLSVQSHAPIKPLAPNLNDTVADGKATIRNEHDNNSGRNPLNQLAGKMAYHPESTFGEVASGFNQNIEKAFPEIQPLNFSGTQAYSPSGGERSANSGHSSPALDPLAPAPPKISTKISPVDIAIGGEAGGKSKSEPTPGGSHDDVSAIPK